MFQHDVSVTGPNELEVTVREADMRTGAILKAQTFYLTREQAKDFGTSLDFAIQESDDMDARHPDPDDARDMAVEP